jgi:DNA-binding MurR/RpiR family transcriptional regulator
MTEERRLLLKGIETINNCIINYNKQMNRPDNKIVGYDLMNGDKVIRFKRLKEIAEYLGVSGRSITRS